MLVALTLPIGSARADTFVDPTFSTEVVDLSEHVHDPLALLLEVAVGGGTHIAKGLLSG